MKYLLPILFLLSCNSRKLISDDKKIVEASHTMKGAGHVFFSCIPSNDLDTCVFNFKKRAKNSYEKSAVANVVQPMNPEISYQLHKEAYNSKPNELTFILEYGKDLQRKGNYDEALLLYEKWSKVYTDNFKMRALLADCYINVGMVDKAIQSWQQADHSKHRIEIEGALHEIYGKSDQFSRRNYYRNEIKKGNTDLFYELLYLDLNWENDWWNTENIDEYYLNADISLLNEKVSKESEMYSVLESYVMIKNPGVAQYMSGLQNVPTLNNNFSELDVTTKEYNEKLMEVEKEIIDIINNSIAPDDSLSTPIIKEEESGAATILKTILLDHHLFLNGYPLPQDGKISNDFLSICITNSVTTKDLFLKEKGNDILKIFKEKKDPEFLNMYTHLMPSGRSAYMEINKKGWKEYKEERFAWAYLITSLIAKKLNETDLDQAILDFPNSSRIYLIKVQKAKLDNKDLKPYLIELIKKEFKRLDSGVGLGASYDKGHNSNALKLYFEILQKSLRAK